MVSPIVCSERKTVSNSIQSRPHIPKRDEHVTKSLDWQARPTPDQECEIYLSKSEANPPNYDQMIPISKRDNPKKAQKTCMTSQKILKYK